MRYWAAAIPVVALSMVGTAPAAQTDPARAMLVKAAFATPSKPAALNLVNRALDTLDRLLAQVPGDREVLLQRGIGLGYRGQLTRSMGDARTARDTLSTLAQRYPNDPEAQIALGGWHLSVIGEVGGFVGGTMLGASKNAGLAATDRAVALGGNRAFFAAYAGLMRLRLDQTDARARALLDRALAAQAPTELDRITQAAARRVVAMLRARDPAGASALARQSLPFGRVS